ncbi:DUF6527 family protein [Pseudomonas sp. SL4(2022)]|uniref:DUF6527 family protein n=1 Tax=Pseudomonas sp. SL4(2022) TaxID=2994661 RepID=UPI00226F822A|nr:DUF6527 family protein [Pseudomonas sp. SL4(2022)]WAC45210.1 DUF6527 family protein [Pseudomonas sp. SL4(2022)]
MTIRRLAPQFVAQFPERLVPGELYLAMEFATAVHLCACGCGYKVITPFSPTDWQMSFDGESVSLKPSIGNWSFRCRSHYWVRSGRVVWAGDMSQEAINAVRNRDIRAKALHQTARANGEDVRQPDRTDIQVEPKETTWFERLKSRLGF